MHAGVPGQELVDPVGHRLQRGRRGGAVEVAVGTFDTVEAGNGHVRADERRHGFLRSARRHTTKCRRAGGIRRLSEAGLASCRRAVSTTMSSELRSSGRHGLDDVVRHPAGLAARRRAQ